MMTRKGIAVAVLVVAAFVVWIAAIGLTMGWWSL
jgi:hypothetical protein